MLAQFITTLTMTVVPRNISICLIEVQNQECCLPYKIATDLEPGLPQTEQAKFLEALFVCNHTVCYFQTVEVPNL